MMDEKQSSEILLVYVVEKNDPEGVLLPESERTRASREAEKATGGGEANEEVYLSERAGLLIPVLEKKAHGLSGGLRGFAARRSWPSLLMVVICLLAGFLAHKLGDGSTINVLAFPLLGLMAWNFAVFAFLLFSRLFGQGKSGTVGRLLEGISARTFGRHLAEPGGDDGGLRVRIARDFLSRWTGATAAVGEARLHVALHLAAAALVIGTVGGMYWDGVAHEYKAKWESTFITRPETAKRFFDGVFAPASAASGIATPTLEEIELARLGEGDAAKWIHLYAVTVGVLVVLPRLWLAALGFLAAGRASRALRARDFVDASYLRRTLVAPKGGNALAVVVPHRIAELPSRLRDLTRATLHGVWGGALVVEFAQPVAYGDEEEFLADVPIDREPTYFVYLAPLSSTPEEESQGLLVTGLRDRVAASEDGLGFLVLLDPTEFVARLEGMPEKERRVAERRQAWERLLASRALGFALLGEDGETCATAVWEPEAVAGGRSAV
jgi:hypothetical protein